MEHVCNICLKKLLLKLISHPGKFQLLKHILKSGACYNLPFFSNISIL